MRQQGVAVLTQKGGHRQKQRYFPYLLLSTAEHVGQDQPEDWCGLCFYAIENEVTLKESA